MSLILTNHQHIYILLYIVDNRVTLSLSLVRKSIGVTESSLYSFKMLRSPLENLLRVHKSLTDTIPTHNLL